MKERNLVAGRSKMARVGLVRKGQRAHDRWGPLGYLLCPRDSADASGERLVFERSGVAWSHGVCSQASQNSG